MTCSVRSHTESEYFATPEYAGMNDSPIQDNRQMDTDREGFNIYGTIVFDILI